MSELGDMVLTTRQAIGVVLLVIALAFLFGPRLPGKGKSKPKFAPNDQVESLRPFVDEFWSDILGTSYSTSFVSNGSVLSSWEQYLPGGRDELIQKVKDKYGVDISDYYDEPIPVVLTRIKASANKPLQ
jgi:hypothetical protein